jgi:membrane glycosyltransferase
VVLELARGSAALPGLGDDYRFHDLLDADAVQAAEINRTVAQKTRRTRRVGFNQTIPSIAG